MQKIKRRGVQSSLLEQTGLPSCSYSTQSLNGDYRKPQIELQKCGFRTSIRGTTIWNNIVRSTRRKVQLPSLLNTTIKNKLLDFEIEMTFL